MPQGDQGRMHLDVQTFIGTGTQMLQAQALQLAIDRLNTLAKRELSLIEKNLGISMLRATHSPNVRTGRFPA